MKSNRIKRAGCAIFSGLIFAGVVSIVSSYGNAKDSPTVSDLSKASGSSVLEIIMQDIDQAIDPRGKKYAYAKVSKELLEKAHSDLINDQQSKKDDTEKWNALIEKYAPIFYLTADEWYLPIAVEEYFTAPHTKIISKGTERVIAPEGAVTMEKIYDLHKKQPAGQSDPGYFDNEPSVKLGSDPKNYSDLQGNLITPAYVLAYETPDALYFQYLLFFGFNGPYHRIDKELFNPHEADLEHVTLELDKKTHKLSRIYFSAHGRDEGVWLPANHSDIEYEATHPVVYIARDSHATYPKAGTFVRVFGFANDQISKGIRWQPLLRRIFPEKDPRFKPSTMGWVYHNGTYGKRGVSAAIDQAWFMKSKEGDLGRPYETAPYCPSPATLECLLSEAEKALPPA